MFSWFRKKQSARPSATESTRPHSAPPPASAEAGPATISSPLTANQSNAPKGLSEQETLKLQIQVRRELEEQLRPEIEAAVQARHQRELHEASQRTLLKYLVTESGQDAEAFYANLPSKQRSVLDSAMRRQIAPKVEQALRAELHDQIRIEEAQKLREELVREIIKDPLQIQVRRELEEQLRPEIEATIQSRCRRELLEASQGTLLNYLVTESGQDVDSFYANLPKKTRSMLDSAIRRQIAPKIEQALRAELHDQIRVEEAQKLREELFKDLKIQVRRELEEQLRPEIEEQLTQELRMPLIMNASGQIEESVAAVIQRHLEVCKEEIRAQTLQEVWQQASAAIVEASGAASTLDDDSLDDAMIAAMDAYETAMLPTLKPFKNAAVEIEPEEGVRKAVEAALKSLGFKSHCWSKHWEWHCWRVKALIGQQFFQTSASSESVCPLDGFYRAIQSYTCDRTGRQIVSGDCYLVFGGLRIALPMIADPAMEWRQESVKGAASKPKRQPGSWPSPADKKSKSKNYRRNP